jgi:hypothetical protein
MSLAGSPSVLNTWKQTLLNQSGSLPYKATYFS